MEEIMLDLDKLTLRKCIYYN